VKSSEDAIQGKDMIDRFQLLRNIGLFDSVSTGAQLPLAKLTVIYGENARGKTTLAAILRSLATGDGAALTERHRLGAAHPVHVVIGGAAGIAQIMFQQGAWSATDPSIAVYDDEFVAQNVCAGIAIENEQRQKLHELILGARGVALNKAQNEAIEAVEEHNRQLRLKGDAIPAAKRGGLTAEQFCRLAPIDNLPSKIEEAGRRLAAANASATIAAAANMPVPALPSFDLAALAALLKRDLPALEAAAALRVQEHLVKVGAKAERWIAEGVEFHQKMAAAGDNGCPFCGQDLGRSDVVAHYAAYFSAAYNELKREVAAALRNLTVHHGGEAQAAFERSLREIGDRREFWKPFTAVPDITLDTPRITIAWKAPRDSIDALLQQKQAAPLEPLDVPPALVAAVEAFDNERKAVETLTARLVKTNEAIALVKEQARAANVAALTADLAKYKAREARYEPETAALCQAYLAEAGGKSAKEKERDKARTALNTYRRDIFPAYEGRVNEYLRRFNAGFRLGQVAAVNTRGSSTASYCIVINQQQVALTADEGPSFRNTLSAGDRNTLALAFFFAMLESNPNLADRTIIIDDPMSSLDEHRTLHTVTELHRLAGLVSQVVVLSHSTPFLVNLGKNCAAWPRASLQVARGATGSTLAEWDVTDDLVTIYDKWHADARDYVQAADPAAARRIAESLRPMLEKFVRIAYPQHFEAAGKLGQFADLARQRVNTPQAILGPRDTAEIRALLDFANRYHHEENPAYQVEAINDGELLDFVRRTLAFTSRPMN
jgi:wobble nucleotide-excising tRNase